MKIKKNCVINGFHFQKGEEAFFDGEGRFHMDGGPAIIGLDIPGWGRSNYWYRHGVLHRTDGPAIEFCGGSYWYINGKVY